MGIVRLRLARFGRKNRAFYRVVAIDSRLAREGRPLEYLGTYDPIPSTRDGFKEVLLKTDRVKYWLSCGAQPSDTVARLLARARLLPPAPVPISPFHGISRAARKELAKAAPAAPAAAPAAKAASAPAAAKAAAPAAAATRAARA